jgi:YD repeat-containing protein
MVDGAGTTRYIYDAAGQLLTEDVKRGSTIAWLISLLRS